MVLIVMRSQLFSLSFSLLPLWASLAVLPVPASAEEPAPAAVATFNAVAARVEARLATQHESRAAFLDSVLLDPGNLRRLRHGELIVEQLTPSADAPLPGAMLHHWRATAFVPGATSASFTRLMQDFAAYPRIYAPQVLTATVLARQGDRYDVRMRVRQRHLLTVILDTTYAVSFGELDAQHRYSASHSTSITEIDSSGRAVSPADEHGFLWRQNTYWSCEERDGGLYLQIESVSLTRSIPTGLGWAVGPFVESVPRDSLTFTLQATKAALQDRQVAAAQTISARKNQ